MALIVDVEAYGGVPVTGAYVRVVQVSGNKQDGAYRMIISCAVYKDEATANSTPDTPNGPPAIPCDNIGQFQCAYDIASTDNALVQAYTYLKTLPEFAGAKDA